jgi:hypothetical protein
MQILALGFSPTPTCLGVEPLATLAMLARKTFH